MEKDLRIKNNLLSGMVYQIVLIVISFLLPRLYLENFGSEINGVLSTIKQIFTYLCLLEAGVGLATTQALYKPVHDKNYDDISSILCATRDYYLRTGFIYTGIVLVIGVLYAYIIPVNMNSNVLFILIILNALPALFSYFVQAKYRILMEVDGRKYIITNSETVLQIVTNIGKILVLLLTDSLILIQLVYCLTALIQLAYLYIYAKKKYKWLDFNKKAEYNAISQKNSVLVHQLSGMVFNNTDVILLSALCDFKTVSIYAIYNIFFSQVQNFITNIVASFSFKFGQKFNADKEKFKKIFNLYESVYITSTFFIYTIMAVFLLPLIQIYTSGINDAEYTNSYLVFLFVIMNLLANAKLPSNHVLEFAGKFEETRSHAIVEMIINIVVSIVSIILWGICGAILGTIVALLYRSIMMIYYANKKVLERKIYDTYKCWLINGCVFAFVMLIYFVDGFSGVSFGTLVVKGIIHSVWIAGLYILANIIFQRKISKELFLIIRRKIKK